MPATLSEARFWLGGGEEGAEGGVLYEPSGRLMYACAFFCMTTVLRSQAIMLLAAHAERYFAFRGYAWVSRVCWLGIPNTLL